MSKPYTSKLGKEYQRPKKTYTDNLTEDDINNLLEDYKKVENIYQVSLGTHMRYFSKVDGKTKFRTGGSLVHNQGLPKYVMLSNGKNSWPVQVKDTTFFAKMTINEIKAEYDEELNKLEKENTQLRKQVNELKGKLGMNVSSEKPKKSLGKRKVSK